MACKFDKVSLLVLVADGIPAWGVATCVITILLPLRFAFVTPLVALPLALGWLYVRKKIDRIRLVRLRVLGVDTDAPHGHVFQSRPSPPPAPPRKRP